MLFCKTENFSVQFSFLELTLTKEKLEKRMRLILGQRELKEKIDVLARRTLFDKKRTKTLRKENDMSKLHMIFAGNPGTGKTMAARCMAGMYTLKKDNISEHNKKHAPTNLRSF